MTLGLFAIITSISMFLSLILALFFFITRKGYPLENRLLSALLVIFSLQIFYSFATSTFAFQFFLSQARLLFLIRQTSLLMGPLIYLYIKAFLKRGSLRPEHFALHALPFTAVVLYLILAFPTMKHFIIWVSVLDLYDTVLILGQTLIYLVFSLKLFIPDRQPAPKTIGSIFRSAAHPWLRTILVGFVVLWIVNLNSFGLYMILQRPGWCAYTASIYALTVFLFINTIMFFLLLKPDIYYMIIKYKNARIREQEKLDCRERIQQYMITKKPYLNPEITLEGLAAELDIPPRTLSMVINDSFGKNFKTFILEYRIRESMEILSEPGNHRLTILEILYQVGFNSKSAFNNQFKLYTNLTPLEYRAQAAGSLRNPVRA